VRSFDGRSGVEMRQPFLLLEEPSYSWITHKRYWFIEKKNADHYSQVIRIESESRDERRGAHWYYPTHTHTHTHRPTVELEKILSLSISLSSVLTPHITPSNTPPLCLFFLQPTFFRQLLTTLLLKWATIRTSKRVPTVAKRNQDRVNFA
jgi:hypothetical protein